MRATRVGRDTVLASIVDLVERAQGSKAPIQRLADRVSEFFVPFVLLVAGLTFATWYLAGPEPRLTLALTAFIAVLVIACPCAMGLATPTAVIVGTGRAAEAGILIRTAAAIERAAQVGTVIFDKTGTLTVGRPVVDQVIVEAGFDESRVVDLAASVERASQHPFAAAIIAYGHRHELGFQPIERAETSPGRGAVAVVAGQHVAVGNARWFDELGIAPGAPATSPGERSNVLVAIDRRHVATFLISDPVRAESGAAVRDLQAAGIEVWLVSGDGPAAAEAVAAAVGIPADRVRGGMLPADKARARGRPPGRRSDRGDGRRRDQRCAGARPGGRRGRDRNRRRCRDRGLGSDPDWRGPAARAVGNRAVAAHDVGDPPEPVLGVRLQHRADPGRDGRPLPGLRHPAQSGPGSRRDGPVLDQRRGQLAPSPTRRRPAGPRCRSRARTFPEEARSIPCAAWPSIRQRHGRPGCTPRPGGSTTTSAGAAAGSASRRIRIASWIRATHPRCRPAGRPGRSRRQEQPSRRRRSTSRRS